MSKHGSGKSGLSRVLAASALAAALVLSGCTAGQNGRPGASGTAAESGSDRDENRVYLSTAAAEPAVIKGTDAEAALAASQTLFQSSPVAVVAPGGDAAAIEAAAAEAGPAGAPLLLAGDGLEAELQRLGVRQVKAFGAPAGAAESAAAEASPGPSGPSGLPEPTGTAEAARTDEATGTAVSGTAAASGPAEWESVLGGVEILGPDQPLDEVAGAEEAAPFSVLLGEDVRKDLPATMAVLQAAGVRTHVDAAADPRADPETIDFLRAEPEHNILAIGADFGSTAQFAARTETAMTAAELPGGGMLAFPSRRMVALYGHPSGPALGALGEQDVEATIDRAKKLAGEYKGLSDEPVVPAFEIIATVATGSAGEDGDYSSATDIDLLRTWVDAAGEAGVYVVLDLQPGRTDFLTQAKAYEELLKEPHVGLALDPEWRLQDGERHMEQIGSVTAAEVNEVSDWLARLTLENNLPQKVLILHQFQLRMISNREQLETGHDELAVVIHADGHGGPGQKLETWRALRQDLPDDVWMGWKNFYDEDTPMFSPERTYGDVKPAPWFVSYQ
ncbi:hypothetical protein [Crystallibacter degradans]|uniref:hypothetical protein n=1 Tax=Crystallibacter degradans TaxID=2726743 RepID=UPI0014759FCD|nr:hypothetical protein [Arthrobacter sp. SF27]NMR31119.1 hypothetical protein [Arthrobacter sp. SF27]